MKFFSLYELYKNLKITNPPISRVGRSMKLWEVVEYTSAMVIGEKIFKISLTGAQGPKCSFFPYMSYIKTENH